MRMFRLMLASTALALASCESMQLPAGETIGAVGDAVVVKGSQALLVAHNAYQGAAAVAELAVKSGQLNREQLLKLRELNNRALVLLERGDAGQSVAVRAAEVIAISTQIRTLVGR